MRKYEIQIKYYYGETSDYGTEIVKAENKLNALKKFAKRKGISSENLHDYENWTWWEGEWYARIKIVKRLTKVPESL